MRNEKDDAAFIRDEDGWPNWPLLPVVEKGAHSVGQTPRAGLITAGEPLKVFVKNLWDSEPIDENTPVVIYDSVEELVLHWRVG